MLGSISTPILLSIIAGIILTILVNLLRADSWIIFKCRFSLFKKIFGNILINKKETKIVLPSFKVDNTYDHEGQELEFPFIEKEKHQTTLKDVKAIIYIYSILLNNGKRKNIDIITSEEFNKDKIFDYNLISIGSKLSNSITPTLLEQSANRFTFDKTARKIIEKGANYTWPQNQSDLEIYDYGLFLKSSYNDLTRIIVAGIGPMGTLGVSAFLSEYNNIKKLANNYGDSDFEFILEINKEKGLLSANIVKERKIN